MLPESAMLPESRKALIMICFEIQNRNKMQQCIFFYARYDLIYKKENRMFLIKTQYLQQ